MNNIPKFVKWAGEDIIADARARVINSYFAY